MATVLTISYDLKLLETRDAILRDAGYRTLSALTKADALTAIRTGGYDLLVLCHSVPEVDQVIILGELRKLGTTPALLLRSGAIGGSLQDSNTTTVQYSPTRFITTVATILDCSYGSGVNPRS